MGARTVRRNRARGELSMQEYLERCDCRCSRLRGTHPAVMCGSAEEWAAAEQRRKESK